MGLVTKDDGCRISDELWSKMEPLLPGPKPHPLGCHRPRVPNRDAMDAIFFLLRNGATWNSLNATGICSKSSAYRRFREWTDAGVFEEFWKRGLLAYDEVKGIDWSWLAMDGTMTKAPLAGSEKTGRNPTDRGKQGVKRSLLTEAKGIPLSVVIDGANRHDMKLVRETLASLQVAPPPAAAGKPRGLCMDKGYDYQEVRAVVEEFGFTPHIRSRGEEARAIRQKAGFRARRWVVERTHSWMNRFRRLLVRWEKRADTYLAMLHLACGLITWRSVGLSK